MHKDIFGCRRDYSVTEILYELNLPNFDTLLHNGATTFTSMCFACPNIIITHLLCYFLNVFLKLYNSIIS